MCPGFQGGLSIYMGSTLWGQLCRVHLYTCAGAQWLPPPHMGIPPYKGHPTPRTHGLQLFVFWVCIRVIFFAWETMLLCFLLTYVNKEKKKFQEPEECITLESNFHWIKGSFQGLVPVQPMMLAHLIVLECKTIESPLMNALVRICCDRGNVSHKNSFCMFKLATLSSPVQLFMNKIIWCDFRQVTTW